MQVLFTNQSGVSGFQLVPQTETESNYLCDLDRETLTLQLCREAEGMYYLRTSLGQPPSPKKK